LSAGLSGALADAFVYSSNREYMAGAPSTPAVFAHDHCPVARAHTRVEEPSLVCTTADARCRYIQVPAVSTTAGQSGDRSTHGAMTSLMRLGKLIKT